MTYTPLKTVIIDKGKLIESDDLSIPASSFVGKQAFLVLEKNLTKYTIAICKILTFEPGLNITLPIGTIFNPLLNDLFVNKYLDTRIPLQNSYGTYNNRLKVFNPISYKDYTVSFSSINTPDIIDDPKLKGYLDDLVISTKDDISNMLVAVNGVFHKTAIHDGKLWVLDGFRNMRICSRKDITIVDTRELGGHSIIPLTSSNVTLTGYNKDAVISPGMSLVNKTVFLVVDGYFYHLDNDVLDYMDESHLKVLTSKLILTQQFRHNPRTLRAPDRYGSEADQSSRKYEDPYEDVFLGIRHVDSDVFKTRDFQYSRLTHYHSFLVVMNSPAVFVTSVPLLNTGTPQFYSEMSNKVVSGMLNYGNGLCPSYLILKDPFKRKVVLLSGQDNDMDWQQQSIDPVFIPSLIPDANRTSTIAARFVDYISA